MLEHFFDELGSGVEGLKPAIVSSTATISYQSLVKSINQLSNTLVKYQVQKLTVILLPNTIETCLLILACLKVKITFVSIDTSFPPNEIKKILAQLKPASIITDDVGMTNLAHDEAIKIYHLSTLMNSDVTDQHHPTLYPDNEESFVALTSGSTGVAKGVTHTNFSLCEAISNVLTSLQLQPYHRLLCTISHPSNAFLRNLLACLIKRSTFILAYKSHFSAVIELFESWSPTHIRFSIKDLITFSQTQRINEKMLATIIRCDVSGDVIPLDIINAVNARLQNGTLITSYAMSECSTIAINELTKESHYQRYTGKIINTVTTKLVDEEGMVVPRKTSGELWVKSTTMFKNYWLNEADTQTAFSTDGWFKTGDYFSVTDDQYLVFEGRKKHLIIKDGKNINPEYIRHIMLAWPDIIDCVVIAEAKEQTISEPIAYCCVKNKNLNTHAFKMYLQNNLHPNWIPPHIFFLADLPRTPFGKINLSYINRHSSQLKADAQFKLAI